MDIYRNKMKFYLWCMPLILLMVTMPCQGFDFTMDRREYLVTNQTYCGLLQCQVDTVSDTNMAILIKMDIYYFNNEQLLVSMLAVNSDIQAHTGNNTIVIGSMSKNHGECHVYFSDVSNCSETSFMCKIQFKNSTDGKEFAKKLILPISSDQNEADIYVKSQISIEQKFFNKAGVLINKLKPNNKILNEGTGFSLTFGHPSLIDSEEISKQPNKTETIPWQNASSYFEQELTNFEVKIGKELDIFMNQMSTKMEDIKNISKEINLKLNEVKEQEIIRRSDLSTSALIQSHIDPKLLTLKKRMDYIIDQVNVSLNLHEWRTNASDLWIIQKLDFLLDDNRFIGLNVSILEVKVTEIMNFERHMNETIKDILKNDRQMNATITEILKNDRQMNYNTKELLKNDKQMNDTIKELLKNERQMKEIIEEILKNDRQMNDTIKEILKNNRQMNDNTKELLKNDRHMNDTIKEILKNNRQMNDNTKELLKNDRQMNDTIKELLTNDRQMKEIIEEIMKNDRHIHDNTKELLKNDRHVNDTIKELLKNDRQMNDTMKEILNNDRQMNDTLKEIQHEVKQINKILKDGEMMGEIQKSINLKINDLQKSVLAKCNFDTLRVIIDQRLSSVEENLKELRIDHETIEISLVNVTRSLNTCNTLKVNQLEFVQQKCEREMSSALGSRVITLLDNKKQVLCDTETDGGGWIIILRRANGLVNYSRDWYDYKYGFGSLDGDFWIGNEVISRITSKEIYKLRIDMREGSDVFKAEFDSFMVKNELDNYILILGVVKGTITSSFIKEKNMALSTLERGNDNGNGSCAKGYQSGWWYKMCETSDFSKKDSCVCLKHPNEWHFLDFVEIKIRLK